MEIEKITEFIRDIPDFPVKGIIFRDITPLLGNFQAFDAILNAMAAPYSQSQIDYVAGLDARGFIFGSAIARQLSAGFIPIRKKGKLPFKKLSHSYNLEYGVNEIEMHIDAVKPNQKVLIVDDLLATGGTIKAACSLLEQLGAEISGISILVELEELKGREKLQGYEIKSLIKY